MNISTGMHSIQLHRLRRPKSTIVALASTKHTDLLKSLRADHVIDYNDPELVQKVAALNLDFGGAVDGYSMGQSTQLAAECMVANRAKDDKSERMVVRTLPPRLMKGTLPIGVTTDWIVS